MRARGLEPPRALRPTGPKPALSQFSHVRGQHPDRLRLAREPSRLAARGLRLLRRWKLRASARAMSSGGRTGRAPQAKTTKALVALVLLISAALVIIITLGGWERLQSSSVAVMSLVYAVLYIVFAVLIMNWNRGLLPVAASLAIILAIFAAIAGPAWFARSKDGLDSPVLPEDLLGLLTLILVPVQVVLIVARDGRLQPGLARRGGAADRRRPPRRRGRERPAARARPGVALRTGSSSGRRPDPACPCGLEASRGSRGSVDLPPVRSVPSR